jgi:hypothetical protein
MENLEGEGPMQNYGVYTRENDTQVWVLENITNRSVAELAEDVNAQFGVETLVVGPLSVFPNFLET